MQTIISFWILGATAIAIISANVWFIAKRRTLAGTISPMIKSVKVAWGISLAAIGIPYLAPIAICVAVYGFLQTNKLNQMNNNRTGLLFTAFNSTYAILILVFTLTFLVNLKNNA